MMLGDAPGGAKFIECLIEAVKDLLLVFAGTTDERPRSSLDAYIAGIELGIVEAVGAGTAPILLNAFRRAAMGRKHEIEAGGASRA
jgi:hypothetical protein